MNRALLTLIAIVALTVASHPASAGADDPELVFDPPLSVNIRQTNGVAARGDILSMNDKELLLKSVSGKEVRIKLERIRSIKNTSETFEYWPGKESFEDLCARVDEVPGAKLMGDKAPAKTGRRTVSSRDEDEGVDSDDQRGRRNGTPNGGGILDKGRPALGSGAAHGRKADEIEAANRAAHQAIERAGPRIATRPEPSKKQKPANVEDATDEPAEPAEPAKEPEPGDTILLCSHCEKELPLAFQSGDACPHCGKVAVFEHESAESAAEQLPEPEKEDPFKPRGAVTTPAPVPAPVPIANASAAAPAAGGGGLADVPLIAKIGVFAAFLIVGWFLLNRR